MEATRINNKYATGRVHALSMIRFIFITIGLMTPLAINGQNTSLEFWPEADIWYRISPSTRVSMLIPVTKYNESNHRDINLYLQGDYAWGHAKNPLYRRLVDDVRLVAFRSWMARGGMMKGWSLGEYAGSYYEDQLYAELHKRIPLKRNFLVSQRMRGDWRWLGEDNTFSYRVRLRVMVEKEFQKGNTSWVPYVNIEPYYDSRFEYINRVRMIVGTTFSRGKAIFWESNLTYQYDDRYDTDNLFAFNLIFHVIMESKKAKKPAY